MAYIYLSTSLEEKWNLSVFDWLLFMLVSLISYRFFKWIFSFVE